jgi:uncharacterized LabA/DUF88 family protein
VAKLAFVVKRGFGGTMRVNFYVDGFNLYYGCVRRTPERWLDLGALCARLFPTETVHRIRYFTALVIPRVSDPLQLQRQQTYIRALETIPNLSVHYGRFQTTKVERELVHAPASGPTKVSVFDPKEKGSDVNIATHLLVDGFRGDYDKAAIISNDADLCLPIEKVIAELGRSVVVICPVLLGHRHPSHDLCRVATSTRIIRRKALQACQFPPTLPDANGVITKPLGW